jgi:hypothetical protein
MIQLRGVVTSAELNKPISGVEILIRKESGVIEQGAYSDNRGNWAIQKGQATNTFIFRKPGFVTKAYNSIDPPEVVRLLEDRLIGYMEKLWFLPGEQASAYVHAPSRFTAKLCRHGLRKEVVLFLGEFESFAQNVPDAYFVDRGLSWKNPIIYEIPADARPGLYSLLLEAEGEESFAIPMVVSTPTQEQGKNSKLLVLASTNTWQMYNIWGGRSRYRNFEDDISSQFLALEPTNAYLATRRRLIRLLPISVRMSLQRVLGRASISPESQSWRYKKLSIRRPFTNCALEEEDSFSPFTNHLAAGEWRVLTWLEREGIPYDVVSGFELHEQPALLSKYKAIILSTHCEYWTREMFEGLKDNHQSCGLWILNISGNSIYREIQLLEDGSSQWRGVFHHNSADEAELLGVRLCVEAYGTCAPYKVLLPEHWVFEGAPLNSSRFFGTMSLNQNTPLRYGHRYDPGRSGLENGLAGTGASGWEVDRLAKSAPLDVKVVAKGMHRRGCSHMVVRESDGRRGGTFSVSSIVFGGSLLIDAVSSVMLQNVIKKALKD